MILERIEDGLYEIGAEDREEPRYYPAPWQPSLLLPSVTTVLGVVRNPYLVKWRGKLGNVEADRVLSDTTTYGNAIHDFTAIMDTVGGGLEIIGVPPVNMLPQLTQYMEWRDKTIAEIIEVERVVYSRKHGYAGRLDRVWRFHGDTLPAIADIKTGTIRPIARAQTAAYQQALFETTRLITNRRGIVEVSRKTGRVGWHEHNNPGDLAGFLSLLTTYNWLVSVGEA